MCKSPSSTLETAVAVLFEVCSPSSILVCIVFWAILAPQCHRAGGRHCHGFYSLQQHGVNTLMLLMDFLMNRLVVHPSHMCFMLLWVGVYCVFVWLQYFGITGWWPYFFLELNWYALVWYPALLTLHAGVFLICVLLSKCKQRIVKIQLYTPQNDIDPESCQMDQEGANLKDADQWRDKHTENWL